jgi:hypothetical protein
MPDDGVCLNAEVKSKRGPRHSSRATTLLAGCGGSRREGKALLRRGGGGGRRWKCGREQR